VSLFAELKRRNVIRVVAAYLAASWLLIQIADTVFPAYGLPDSAVGVLVTVLAIGLLPTIALAWVFEWTPQGLRRDADIAAGEPRATAGSKKLDRIIIAILALGVCFFAVDKFVFDPGRDAALERQAEERGRTRALVQSFGDKSIAVLPFVDMSPERDHAYFSDGIAEEILNLLARVRELRVISRSSAFQYRGDDIHIPTVAEELNVGYVLEGSVRTAGNSLRITAQLIDARADAHVWSETYDRSLDDIFAIQDEISAAIVEQLQATLLGGRQVHDTTDPETYALFLQARYRMDVEQVSDEVAEDLLRQALDRDPEYLPALNLLVKAIFDGTGYDSTDKYTPEVGIPTMRRLVDRILAIDPDNATANGHRGGMAFFYDADIETAATYIQRALDSDPANVDLLGFAAAISRRIGRNDDAIAFAEAALARDPLCSSCLYLIMQAAMRNGQYEKALQASERRMRVAAGGWFTRGNIYLLMGEPDKALELYESQREDRVGWLSNRAITFHTLGNTEQRDAALKELATIDEQYARQGLAMAYAWIGDIDKAFDLLDDLIDPDGPVFGQAFSQICWDPFYANLWDDPRWQAWREQAGLGAERLEHIRLELPR